MSHQPINAADLTLSRRIENLLVSRNLRGMKAVQPALKVGYYLRAAQLIQQCQGVVLIGTGFPVAGTFETDGPVGAIALYNVCEQLGAKPILVCGKPLSQVLAADYRVHEIFITHAEEAKRYTEKSLSELNPELVISIERPGLSREGRYFNMRGDDISHLCANFDYFMTLSKCPTIGVGDGGNEIGMGNIIPAISQLDIIPAVTACDELLIADVSNWAAYGLIALLAKWQGEDFLATLQPLDILRHLSQHGSVDGVTGKNTLTEDGLPFTVGEELIANLRKLIGFV